MIFLIYIYIALIFVMITSFTIIYSCHEAYQIFYNQYNRYYELGKNYNFTPRDKMLIQAVYDMEWAITCFVCSTCFLSALVMCNITVL